MCVCESGEEETEESSERGGRRISREMRYPLLYWSTAYKFVYCAGIVLRVVGPKSLLSVYPTWVSGYCPASLGSYNSLLNSPYFYVQKSVGISNTITIISPPLVHHRPIISPTPVHHRSHGGSLAAHKGDLPTPHPGSPTSKSIFIFKWASLSTPRGDFPLPTGRASQPQGEIIPLPTKTPNPTP